MSEQVGEPIGREPAERARPRRRGLLSTSLRLAATTAVVGSKLTRDVTEQASSIARELVDGARHGASPAQLAETVIGGVSGAVRDAGHAAGEIAEVVPNPVSPVSDAARAVVGQLPVGQLPVGQIGAVAETTARDIRAQLRRRGQQLLRRSTALDDPDEHPAFAHILDEMAPDEARIIRLLATVGPQPYIDVVEYNSMSRDTREVSRHVSLIGSEAGCIRPELTPLYLDNLDRLGLIHLEDYRVGGQEAYDLLEAQPGVDQLPAPKGMFRSHKRLYRSAHLSQFGRYLFHVCFDETSGPVDLGSLVVPDRADD